MFNGFGVFTYLGKRFGVSKDGEKFVVIDCVTKDNGKYKISFLSKNPDLVDNISQRSFHDFQDIKLNFNISRVYNKDKKVSYWSVELVGVD